ncbi:MAG: hypothetical protein QFX33_03380 [Candidatus Nezhaarchaeota archaeon]|nr:hypothetical protein [Candidatus Nezhaarchaeota archaeon]
MVDNDILNEVLTDCKPYLAKLKEIEGLLEELSSQGLTLTDLCSRLESAAKAERDPLLKTDIRILLSELRAKINPPSDR